MTATEASARPAERGTDISELVGLHTRGAQLILGVYLVSNVLFNKLRNSLKDIISDIVTTTVVNTFKVINIHHYYRQFGNCCLTNLRDVLIQSATI